MDSSSHIAEQYTNKQVSNSKRKTTTQRKINVVIKKTPFKTKDTATKKEGIKQAEKQQSKRNQAHIYVKPANGKKNKAQLSFVALLFETC